MNIKNWPVMLDVLRQIIKYPETWDQENWVSRCGTQACIAGWAAQLGGYIPIATPRYGDLTPWPSDTSTLVFSGTYDYTDNFVPRGDNPEAVVLLPVIKNPTWTTISDAILDGTKDAIDAQEAAIKVLGLESIECACGCGDDNPELFSGRNEIKDIFEIIARYAEEDDIEIPEDITKAMEKVL
jgi:hypothetical protein